MNKFAQQFNSDVIVRYQQKLAALVKAAAAEDTAPDNTAYKDFLLGDKDDLGPSNVAWRDFLVGDKDDLGPEATAAKKNYSPLKADDMQVPETTWFENLANSAPISALLDAAEATGVDRWADDINNSLAGSIAGDIGTNIGDWVGELERGSEGDIAQAVAQTRYNDVFNSMQNKAIDTFNRYKKENPFADVSFVPQADQGVLSVLMDKSPDTIARNIGKIPSEAVRKFDPRYMETSLDAIVPIAARSSIPDYFGGLKADKTGYSFFKPWKGEFQIGVYPKDMPRVGPVNLDNLYNLSIK